MPYPPPSYPNSNPYLRPDVNDILKKYGRKIESQVNTTGSNGSGFSQAYSTFKEEMAPAWTRYERWCHSLGNVIKLKIAKKDELKVKKQLDIAHLDIEPWQSVTLSAVSFFIIFVLGIFISISIYLFTGTIPVLFFVLLVISSLFLFYYISSYPERFANQWRLKASSQMVPAILYIVVYMRHTSNLEKAVSFAAEHLQYPLALDFKKVFYDVEVGKFSTIKESLDHYLEVWRDYSSEFIESFHLIESSLFEPDNNSRIATLEKALQVILDGVYDKMLKFVHDVRSPIQSTYMLGTTLPVLGLALLPLASLMVGNILKASHVFILYNLIIPFVAFFLMNKYMMMRPGGHGETSLLERNPLYHEYKSREPYLKAFLVCFPLLILGFLPFIFQFTIFPDILGLPKDFTFSQIGLGILGDNNFFGFVQTAAGVKGPFGAGALILSMFIPLGLAMFFSIAYKGKTRNLIKERQNTKELEAEFNNSLFQLGNRLGNGTPPELVFGRVAESTTGLKTSEFFKRVNYNIQQGGMSVEGAIFERKRGAINFYPSDLIATSMRILVEAAKKGLKIAAVSLMSISEYVKNIQKISDRLKDLLAEIISDMKSNMTFLAPLLAGVVVGLAGMITTILNKLNLQQLQGGAASGLGNFGDILSLFDMTNMIPPYFLQIAIGIYLVQITFILTGTLTTVNSGEDKLEKTNSIGRNLKSGILLYFIVALLSTLTLFILASVVLGNIGG
ncbi:MAG: hypothetical protein PHH00_03720 [Candidatus Nanoarchaeia archaeon]|nr:hypothetical protein [Candidatus Nanoarchaeia archaeon]